MFWYAVLVISWALWLPFADKTRWRELFPVSVLASLLAFFTDLLMYHDKLWEYDGGILTPILVNGFGIYIVITYLFIQWLPRQKTFWPMAAYWFVWNGVASLIEYIEIKTGHMAYHLWWNIGWSYVADTLLYYIFYQYHKAFQLERLSPKSPDTQ